METTPHTVSVVNHCKIVFYSIPVGFDPTLVSKGTKNVVFFVLKTRKIVVVAKCRHVFLVKSGIFGDITGCTVYA